MYRQQASVTTDSVTEESKKGHLVQFNGTHLVKTPFNFRYSLDVNPNAFEVR